MSKFRWFMVVAFILICSLGWVSAEAEDIVLPSVSTRDGVLDMTQVPKVVVSTICVDSYKWIVVRSTSGDVSIEQVYGHNRRPQWCDRR